MRQSGGFMGGEMIFLLALMMLATFGVYKYMKAETNSYVELVDQVKSVQSQANSNGDMITEAQDETRKLLNRIQRIEHKLELVESQANGNGEDIEDAQDHIALVRKEVQKIDHAPKFVTLVTDDKKPIPISVVKTPRKKTLTRKKTTKTKTGIVSIEESNTVNTKSKLNDFKTVRKKKATKKKTKKKTKRRSMPGARSSKKAMLDAGL